VGRINYWHVGIALLTGLVLMHLYRTKTTAGKKSGA
jgi:hypothetical protein